MPTCQQVVSINKLEFLALDDFNPVAEQFRTRPVLQVKKTYGRFAALPRLATLGIGELRPYREFTETTETLGGGVFIANTTVAEVESALVGCDLSGWLYLLADVIDEPFNWAWAVKIEAFDSVDGGIFLNCVTLYKRLANGFWGVSFTPFEEISE